MPDSAAVRSTVYLESDLHHALRLKSATSRRSMSKIVNEAVREALREDQQDLAVTKARRGERTLDYESFLARLRADGTL